MDEKNVQAKIVKALQKAGCYVIVLKRTNKEGINDLQAFKFGALLAFIEVKRPGGKLKPLQVQRRNELRRFGLPSIVAASVEECFEKLGL